MIKLNDKYAIKSDENQWMLCVWVGQKIKNKKYDTLSDGWKPVKYYSSITQLVEGTATLLLRKSQYSTFRELLDNQRAINAMIDDKLKGL